MNTSVQATHNHRVSGTNEKLFAWVPFVTCKPTRGVQLQVICLLNGDSIKRTLRSRHEALCCKSSTEAFFSY